MSEGGTMSLFRIIAANKHSPTGSGQLNALQAPVPFQLGDTPGSDPVFHPIPRPRITPVADGTEKDCLEVIGSLWLDQDLGLETPTTPSSAIPRIALEWLFDPETADVCLQLCQKPKASIPNIWKYEYKRPGWPSLFLPLSGKLKCYYGETMVFAVAGYSLVLEWIPPIPCEEGQDLCTILRELAIQDRAQRQRLVGKGAARRARGSSTKKLPPYLWYFHGEPVECDDSNMEFLAGGSQGTKVFKVENARTKRAIAVKVLHLSRDKASDRQLENELLNLSTLKHHDHIAKFLGYDRLGSSLGPRIFFKLYMGTLRDLQDAHVIASLSLHDEVLRQMLSALDYLNHEDLCHRDVKPTNILYHITEDMGKYMFVLSDFGVSRRQGTGNTEVGTHMYKAPEVYTDASQDSKMDVWSLLITFMQIYPYYKFPSELFSAKISTIQKAATDFGARHKKYEKMAKVNPDERSSARDLLTELFDGEGVYKRRSGRKRKQSFQDGR